jgi:hypothetical protein
MKLHNNTPMEVFYGIAGGGSGDCGTIPPNQTTANLSFYDNKQDVRVTFEAVAAKTPPGESTPFSVTIPQSGTGTAVTIGLFQQ